MSRNISIKIENLVANISGDPVIVCNNSDYVITFAFDGGWDAYDVKTARFVYTSGGHIRAQDIVFTGNVCPVPVFTGISDVLVGVFAGDLHTTTPAKIYCRKSILDYDGPPEEPDPDVYAQIMELINSGQLQGPAGNTGATYTPAVSNDGLLRWTNDRGLDNPEPVNIRGPQGKDGSPGPQGPPGDNTAALDAAQVAMDAAAKANAAADAARGLAPAVEQLKNDLNNKVSKKDYAPEAKTDTMTQPVGKDSDGKLWTDPSGLPTNPAQWPEWSEDNQSAARERMGLYNYSKVVDTEITEDVQNIIIEKGGLNLDNIRDIIAVVTIKGTEANTGQGLAQLWTGRGCFNNIPNVTRPIGWYDKTIYISEIKLGPSVKMSAIENGNMTQFSGFASKAQNYNYIIKLLAMGGGAFGAGSKIEVYVCKK